MTNEQRTGHELRGLVERLLAADDLRRLTTELAALDVPHAVAVVEGLGFRQRAVVYRLLPKDLAAQVFERLDPTLQRDMLSALRDEDVAAVFAQLHADDRVGLLEELPASVAGRLLRGLPPAERDATAEILGYPLGSIGRRMSPDVVVCRPDMSAGDALETVRARLHDAETVYLLPAVDGERRLVGLVHLRDVLAAAPGTPVSDLMHPPRSVRATADAETAARECAELKLLAMPVVDGEDRLVGVLTVDDALRILEDAETEDQARIGGVEPLRQPYLSTPVRTLVRSRVTWLLFLALGAALTVQVLEVFEATLDEMVVLTVFIPLLIGTGGNTGNQAATTVTRALALEDVHPRDVRGVLGREMRVGLSLGVLLGSTGFVLVALFYGVSLGLVVGLTLLTVCTMAASVGGVMPLVGRRVGVDPAVFSNPFITTFVDATGLLLYFAIARAVLGT